MSRLNCSPDVEIHKLSFGFAFKVIPGLLFFSKLRSVILAALMRANIGWPNEGKRNSRGAHGCILVAAIKLNCSLYVEVQKLSFDFFLLYAMRMHSCFKEMCVRCFYVLVMLVQRRRLGITVFYQGMLGPESIVGYPEFITGLCYMEAAVLHRI